MKKIIDHLLKYKMMILICIICVFIELLMDLFLPFILSDTINIGILNNDINYILRNILLMLIILFIGIIGSFFSTLLATKVSINITYDLRKELIDKLLNIEYKNIDKLNTGKTISLLTLDLSNIENILFMMLKIMIKIPIIIVGSIILCLKLSVKLSSILLIIIPLIILIAYIFIKKTYPFFKLTSESLDMINGDVRENVNNIKLVKSNTNEEYEKKKFDKLNKRYKTIDTRAIKTISSMMPIITFIINIAIILILIISKNEIQNNNFLIGNVTAFIEYINLLLFAIMSVSIIFLLVIQSSVSIKRINELLVLEDEELRNGIKPIIKGDIEFKNVSFKYNKKYNLKDINLKINKGEKVGIIGPSGSGKTTLLNLLKQNYRISKGEILVDNINIENYNLKYLRKNIKIINGKSLLFKDTVLNNIRLGLNKKIDKYIKIANAKDIINKHNNVEQRGKNLSGGERQRIVLCRSLIEEPSIILIDDILSSVDASVEEKIMNNILNEYKNNTIIFISNRINNIKKLDKIILMDNGSIVNIGTHSELLKEPLYKELYSLGGGYNE